MNGGERVARAAMNLIGAPFRLHGRNPETGLDCVGVIVATLRAEGRHCALPTGYSLRTGDWPDADDWAQRHGFEPVSGSTLAGDILLVKPGPGQLHLMVVAPDATGVVEAHASLRKVVLGPLPSLHSIVRQWRLRALA